MFNIFIKNKKNKYEEKLLKLKEKFSEIEAVEKKSYGEGEFFSLLLAAVPSLMNKIPFFAFEMKLREEGIKGIKRKLEALYNITDRDSALDKLLSNKHNGCSRDYNDFRSFWEGNPSFNIEELNENGLKYFNECKDFAYKFYNVLGEKGFSAWDIGESINIVRDCFLCGYIDKDLSNQIINDFTNMALMIYDSFEEYALSYLSGSAYYMYRNFRNEKDAFDMINDLYEYVNDLFFDETVNVWAKYEWIKIKKYFSNIRNEDNLIDSDLGCIVSDRISVDGCSIGYMYKEEPMEGRPDSGWRFFSGDESDEYTVDPNNLHVFPLNTVCNYDKDIINILDSEIGSAYFRDNSGNFIKEKLNDDIIGNDYPINISEYSKFIIIKDSSEEYMLDYIKEYGELNSGDKKSYEFKYHFVEGKDNSNYIIIKCPDHMDFYNYHNLSAWFYGYGKYKDMPQLSAVVSFNKENEEENYYAYLDPNNSYGDTLIGVFDNGTRFFQYLPEGFKENGNIVVGYNNLEHVKVTDYLESMGLSIEDLYENERFNIKSITVEMSI